MTGYFVRSRCKICGGLFPHSSEYSPQVCGNVRCQDEARSRNRRRIGRDTARVDTVDLCPTCGADPIVWREMMHEEHHCEVQ